MVTVQRIVAVVAFLLLCGLGVLFVIASAYSSSRLIVGSVMIGVSIVILYIGLKHQPPVVQKVEVKWAPGGPVGAKSLECPNCGASLPAPDPSTGVTTCSHCGWNSSIAEEPIW